MKVYVDEMPKDCETCQWKNIIDCCALSEYELDKDKCSLNSINELEVKLNKGV